MTTTLSNIIVALGTAFVISAASAMTLDWKNQSVDSLSLKQNTDAIKELTIVVRELQINQAVAAEKYVTKGELENRLKGSN